MTYTAWKVSKYGVFSVHSSLRNKLDFLVDMIKYDIDILMISETKVDDPFPDGQILLDGFGTPFRLDWKRNGGGVILFIRNYILAKVVSTDDRTIEIFYDELHFLKKKWLLKILLWKHSGKFTNYEISCRKGTLHEVLED